MSKENFQSPFKQVFTSTEIPAIADMPGEILHINGIEPDINKGDGALLTNSNSEIIGNIISADWRLRENRSKPQKAASADFVAWSLKNKKLETVGGPIHPDKISLGSEDEGSLITEEPFTPGDLTRINSNAVNIPSKIKLNPELLINALELTSQGGYYGYEQLLQTIKAGRRSLIIEALQNGQHPIFTGTEPLATNPGIHPHPYLQTAGRTVADRYLNLEKSSFYYQTAVDHILEDSWNPQNPEDRISGLAQFRVNGYQTNINIPEDDQDLAIPLANYLFFSEISIKLASLLNSSPAVAGVLTPWSDSRYFAKKVLKSSGPQKIFSQNSGKTLEHINQAVVDGWVSTVARGMCLGINGYNSFHGLGRIRGDRGEGSSTWEDMLPSSSHDELQAAYSYIKACQTSYLTHCLKNKRQPEEAQFTIPLIQTRESILEESAQLGPYQHRERIISHLEFLSQYLEIKGVFSQNFHLAKDVIMDALTQPSEFGTRIYLDPSSANFRKGTLSQHLRADIEENARLLGGQAVESVYDELTARAIHLSMLDYSQALQRYYDL